MIEAESGVVAAAKKVCRAAEKRAGVGPRTLQGIGLGVPPPALRTVAGWRRGSYIRALGSGGLTVARKAVLHEDDYVISDGLVRLSVLVGERQFGTSMVFLNDELIANGIIEDLPIGEGGKVSGKTLDVYTLVTDIRDNTDEMSVTWILTGGYQRTTGTETAKPSKKFGSQMFKGVFHLTSA